MHSLGIVGVDIIPLSDSRQRILFKKLKNIDWSRTNVAWSGRAMHKGVMSKSRTSVILTANYIKECLGLKLNIVEREIEKRYQEELTNAA